MLPLSLFFHFLNGLTGEDSHVYSADEERKYVMR